MARNWAPFDSQIIARGSLREIYCDCVYTGDFLPWPMFRRRRSDFAELPFVDPASLRGVLALADALVCFLLAWACENHWAFGSFAFGRVIFGDLYKYGRKSSRGGSMKME